VTDEEAGSLGKLLAEVSAEMAHMREAHAVDVARAAAEERAAVVAWLRGRPGYGPVADSIEEGEHLGENLKEGP
jgi:hypothetical protein